MAIDSEAKRWSTLQWASGPSYYPLVFNPDTSGLVAIERATVLKLYGGIPLTGPATTCALSGTVTTAEPADIVTGGRTIILTLTNDTWVDGAAFDAQRQPIIDGLVSAGAEPTGWNAEVRDKEVVTAVARTSPQVVTVTLTAAPAYAITASETITDTVPAAALVTSGVPVVASPTFALEPATVEVEAPPAAGGGEPSRRRRERGRREARPPFTGRGFFPDAEPPAEVEGGAEAPVGDPGAAPEPTAAPADEPTGPGLDELAAARARREAQRQARTDREREAQAEVERQREDDGRRLLAFLEAEQAARAAEDRLRALLADDEAVIAAYLEGEQALRARLADALESHLDHVEAVQVLRQVAGTVLKRALRVVGD